MREWIDKILVVINECKDPIKNTRARDLRDDTLTILAQEFLNMDRRRFESFAKNDEELQSLSWFYTRFIHNRTTTAGDGRSVK